MDTRDALARARESGLDLVEVAPQAKPPVCRIMDYGKWKYAQKKKDRKAKAHRHEQEMKMVRIRTPKIGSHDLEIKIEHARAFLERGDRVQFVLWFRGREMAHQEVGREILAKVKEGLAEVAKVERDFRMEGRNLSIVLAPTIKPKRKKAEKPTEADRAEAAEAEAMAQEQAADDAADKSAPAAEAPAPAPAVPEATQQTSPPNPTPPPLQA